MGKIVQCLNCWSEGEIDEKIWARDYDPIIPDELQSIDKRLIKVGSFERFN